jgi:hypothetical protein
MKTPSYHPNLVLIGLFRASEIKIREYLFLDRETKKTRMSKTDFFKHPRIEGIDIPS